MTNNLYIYYKLLYTYCYKIPVRYCRLTCALKRWANHPTLYLYLCVDTDNIIIVFRTNTADMYRFLTFSAFRKGKIKKNPHSWYLCHLDTLPFKRCTLYHDGNLNYCNWYEWRGNSEIKTFTKMHLNSEWIHLVLYAKYKINTCTRNN